MNAEVNIGNRYALLASAISGRPLEVADGDPGRPAWSDGRTVFIDAESAPQAQLQCVVVQASLICAGSLEPRVLHKLTRKPSAARRYLSLEGHRAVDNPVGPPPERRSSLNRPTNGTTNRFSSVIPDARPRVRGDPRTSGRLWSDSSTHGRLGWGKSN